MDKNRKKIVLQLVVEVDEGTPDEKVLEVFNHLLDGEHGTVSDGALDDIHPYELTGFTLGPAQ